MHPWEKIYKQDKFRITTLEPSVVVKENDAIFSDNTKVLDIGCGNGRNTIFLAKKGCMVEAIDLVNLDWIYGLNRSLRERINFQKIDIDNFDWNNKKYDVVLLLRIMQYLSFDQLQSLIKNIQIHLMDQGFLLLSYVRKGGIQNKFEIDVPKFSHDIMHIRELLKKYFVHIHISKGATSSIHVEYNEPIESYDIICSKSVKMLR
ncbi:MAG: class I SAM-dependent methyltransferase [Candidatus Paceibacterota bacterium]